MGAIFSKRSQVAVYQIFQKTEQFNEQLFKKEVTGSLDVLYTKYPVDHTLVLCACLSHIV